MDFHMNSLILLSIAKAYATKTNKIKSLEVSKLAENTFNQYTKEEFIFFRSEDQPLQNNPGATLKEKFHFIYILTKEKLINNNDLRLVELNNLLQSLNKNEEDELMDVITMTLTKPGEILYDLL